MCYLILFSKYVKTFILKTRILFGLRKEKHPPVIWIVMNKQLFLIPPISLKAPVIFKFGQEIDKLTLKLILKYIGSRRTKTTLKRTKLKDFHYLTLRFIIKLQKSRQCDISIKIDR